MRAYPFALAANATIPFRVAGGFLRVYSATDAFRIQFDGKPDIPAGVGERLRGRFEHFTLINPSAAPLSGVVIVGEPDEDSDSNALVIAPGQSITPTTPPNFADIADVAVPDGVATQVLAASATRREAIIHNPAAIAIRVGSANVGAARGIPIAPGGTAVLTTRGAVYVYQTTGAAIPVPVAETAD